MGRKVQITRDMILETALQLLIREGYGAVTLQRLAQQIGCSTQPIVWHFENMQNFRKELLHYCIAYTKERFTVWNGSLEDMLTQTACRYITIAREMPHLFRFVYADNKTQCKNSDIIRDLQLDNTPRLLELLCREKGLSEEQATRFLMNYEFYIHGIASYTAGGFCSYTPEQIQVLARQARNAFLMTEMAGEEQK